MLGKTVFLFFLAALTAWPAHAQIARVKHSVGIAAIQRGAVRLPTAPGLALRSGDRIVTGKTGRVSLSFVDNTRFAVGPNSEIAVSQFEYDRTRQSGAFVTQVNRGSLAVVSGKIAKSGRDAMKVRTPNSLLGVRGTRFIVKVPQ